MPRSWYGNFSYKQKQRRGSQEYFTGVKALKKFELQVFDEDEETFSVLETTVGMEFQSCWYDPATRELSFYLDDDLPPLVTQKCECCNKIMSVDREEPEEVREEKPKPRRPVPEGGAPADWVGSTAIAIIRPIRP